MDTILQLAQCRDFVVGGYLSRDHLSESGIDPADLEADFILEGMGMAANDGFWSIVCEAHDNLSA